MAVEGSARMSDSAQREGNRRCAGERLNMRKALIGAASVLTVGLAGCGAQVVGQDTPYKTYRNLSAALWIDPETKCEYIGGSQSAAMTPRLGRDGKHICR